MVLQRLGVGFLHAFENFYDDGREAVCIEVDFLVVGYLSDVTTSKMSVWSFVNRSVSSDLT